MAVTSKWYSTPIMNTFGTTSTDKINWTGDTIKMTLHTVTYTPNQDTHAHQNDLTNELSTAGGYTAGGNTLGTKTLTYNSGTKTIRFKAADSVWAAATFTARYAVIADTTPGTAATNPLMGYIDFGADQSPSGVTFTVQGDATDGFLRAVVS